YTIRASEIVDTSGTPFPLGSLSYTVTGDEDHTAPTLLAVNPPPDSDNIPLTTAIQLKFSEPCATCFFPGAITMLENGAAKTVKVSLSNFDSSSTLYTIGTTTGLLPSSTYTVMLTGIVDLAGNSMPDYSFSFNTAASTVPVAPLKLLDSSLADGDTGVDPDGRFVFHYDGVLNPVAEVNGATITGVPSGFTWAVRSTALGSTLTVTPVAPLPAKTSFRLTAFGTAVTGASLSAQINFTTAASDDTTQPTVTSIFPPDGSVLTSTVGTFVLTFSKPFNRQTITSNSISMYANGSTFSGQPVLSEDNRTVILTVGNVALNGFSVVVSDAVKDLAGNSLVPFEANYTVNRPADPVNNAVHEVRPAYGSKDVVPDTKITWFMDRPVDLAAIQANLLVLSDYTPIAGTFDTAANGTILRFTPAKPFAAGANVSIYQRNPVLGASTYNYNNGSGFTIATPPDPGLRFVRTTVGSSAATDSVFDIEFTQDPPPGKTI